jgi:hypothetical protein
MPVLREALREYLLAPHPDIPGVELSTILTGGIHDAQTADRAGADTSWIARDPVNNITILPFAVLRFRGVTGKEVLNSKRRFVEVWIYQDTGYTQIERAKSRIEAILHKKQVQADDAGVAMFHWHQDAGEFIAPEYENAAGDCARYYVDYVRK